MIETTAKRFYDDHCNRPDPYPELIASTSSAPAAAADEQPAKVSGAEIARKNIAAERAEAAAANRKGLGAGNLARGLTATEPTAEPQQPKVITTGPAITILNAPKAETFERPVAETPPAVQASMNLPTKQPSSAVASKCRVWQASYGGQRAIIIRSKSDGYINYTVLDVNEGTEKREAEAYIQAYARGGEPVGEFSTQNLALDKAFDLCPEG